MELTLRLGPNGKRPYDLVSSPQDFKDLMSGLRGSSLICSFGRDEIIGQPKNLVYHVQPEGLTLQYKYLNLGNADLDFNGSANSISIFKRRFRKMLA